VITGVMSTLLVSICGGRYATARSHARGAAPTLTVPRSYPVGPSFNHPQPSIKLMASTFNLSLQSYRKSEGGEGLSPSEFLSSVYPPAPNTHFGFTFSHYSLFQEWPLGYTGASLRDFEGLTYA